MSNLTNNQIVGIIILAVIVIIFVPHLVIWALNTLFPVLAIAHTWKTWAAIVIVIAAINSR